MTAIRLAAEPDLPAILAMMQAFEAHLTAIDPADPNDTPSEKLAALARFAIGPLPCRGVLLAEAGGEAQGFLAFSEIVWMDDGAPALWMSDLFVAEGARGLGLGRALVEAARAETRARGGRRLVFTVWDCNAAARAFYARLGAVPVAGEITLSLGG
jgi:GNAT superfamily N-acetyltransferase